MKTFRLFTTIAALSLAHVTTAAPPPTKPPKVSVQAPKGGPKAPKVSTTTKATGASKAASAKAAKAPKPAKSATASGRKSHATTASTSTTSGATSTSTGTSTTGGTTAGDTTTGTGTGTDTGTGTTPDVAQPNAISTKISGNPAQLARVQGMLPQGMTLEQATKGFSNQGQFLAALNASKNQGVSFADLQKAMTVDGMSLGQAVKKVKAAPAPAPAPGTETGTGTGTGTTSGTGTPPPGGSL